MYLHISKFILFNLNGLFWDFFGDSECLLYMIQCVHNALLSSASNNDEYKHYKRLLAA